MSTHTSILIFLGIYCLIMLGVSWYWMMRVKKPADYLVAGRGLPGFILAGTIVGTCVGTGVVIGASGLAYKHGWAGCAYPIGLGFGTLLTGWLFSRMRRYKFMTLSEEISCFYGNNRAVVQYANISLFISQLCWLTVQIMGGAAVLGVCTGFNHQVCVVLAGMVTALISIPGGLKTVVYTDFVQALILLFGFGCLMTSALAGSGGWHGLHQSVPAEYTSFLGVDSFGGWAIFTLILTLVLSVFADPGRRLTMYSASTEKGARWSMISAGAVVMAFSVIIGITGMYAYRLNPNLPVADQALPWLVMNVLPPWLAGLIVVSIVSAVFSSANGNAAALGTYYVRHIFPLVTGRYPQQPLRAVRWALIMAFLLATVLALNTGSIVGFVVQFLPLTMSGLAVVVVLGLFWRRATWQGALAALVVTPAFIIVVKLIPEQTAFWGHAAVPAATAAGVLAEVIVSLMTTQPKRSFDEIAAVMQDERQKIEG